MAGYVRQAAASIIPGAEVTATPLNNEFNALQSAFSGTTGHGHTGAAGDGPKLPLTTSVSGILPVANGGTGVSTVAAFRTDMYNAVIDLGVAGTASSPGYSFLADTNTGIWNAAADSLGFTTGGVNRLTLSTAALTSTLPVVVPLGAVGAPSMTFAGDLDTGIYSPAANQVAITAGGVQQALFTATTNTIVGNTTINGSLTADSSLSIAGAATFASTVGITGTLTLNSSNAIITSSTNALIRPDTADGADNKQISLLGGGGYGTARGSIVAAFGNEHATYPGFVRIIAGSGGQINLEGAVNATSALAVTGASTLASVTASGTLDVTGAATFASTANFTGAISTASNVEIAGATIFTGSAVGIIRHSTASGADNNSVNIYGGGGATTTRGAAVLVYGLNHASFPGTVRIIRTGSGTVSLEGPVTANNTLDVTGAMTVGGDVNATGNVIANVLRVSRADSVTAPGISWNGDTNTGLWNAAADSIGFTTGGVNRMTLSTSLDVGVQYTGPLLRLTNVTSTSLTSTNHAFQIGPDTGNNLAISWNRIQARSNGIDNTLALNPNGGNVTVNTNTIWHSGNLISPVESALTITAGNGLSGGGNLGANRTISMGTPSSITNSTTNSVTATSHTHALGFLAAEVYTGSSSTLTDYPVGTLLLVANVTRVNRNAVMSVYLNSGDATYFSDTSGGTALAGTWRGRGSWNQSGQATQLVQRVA